MSRSKKRWSVRWRYTGDKTEFHNSVLVDIFTADNVRRYNTERAAREAIEAWRIGRGTNAAIHKPDSWVVALFCDGEEVSV